MVGSRQQRRSSLNFVLLEKKEERKRKRKEKSPSRGKKRESKTNFEWRSILPAANSDQNPLVQSVEHTKANWKKTS